MSQTFAEATINNAKRTGKSVKEILELTLKADYDRAPKSIWNKFNIQLDWDAENKIYLGEEKICLCGVGEQHHDEKGKCPAKNAKTSFKQTGSREWIASLQTTQVPIYNTPCKAEVRKGNLTGPCNGVNYTPLHENGRKFNCRICGAENVAEINVDPSSVAFPLTEALASSD